jgi:2-oxo-4-hydroxy-4-carboxy-5-ureidoimidazoline decarboxylase
VKAVDALATLNAADPQGAGAVLRGCCAAHRWAESMERHRPFASADAALEEAERAFAGLEEADWLEAFAAHARVGQPHSSDPTGAAEQSGASTASPQQVHRLAERNAAYEARFGHVFLICASGLDATAMLEALEDRYENPPARELELAAAEQRRITRLRLRRLLETDAAITSAAAR